MAKTKPAKMLAVLGRCRRTGRWRVGTRSSILAVLGSCRLDMRSSFVEEGADEMTMKVIVFLGSAVFVLPDGAEVRPSGMSLLSAETVDVPEHAEPSGLPTLEIEWTSVLGRVRVVTGPAMERLEAEASEARSERRGRWGHKPPPPRSTAGTADGPEPAGNGATAHLAVTPGDDEATNAPVEPAAAPGFAPEATDAVEAAEAPAQPDAPVVGHDDEGEDGVGDDAGPGAAPEDSTAGEGAAVAEQAAPPDDGPAGAGAAVHPAPPGPDEAAAVVDTTGPAIGTASPGRRSTDGAAHPAGSPA